MMDKLRTASNSWVLKIILAVIILSFVLTGVSGYLISDTKDYTAKVNGQKIPIYDFERAVQNRTGQLQEQLGEQYSVFADNPDYMKQLRQDVLSNLIDQTLLEQYAKELGLSIDAEQIKDEIRKTTIFQNDEGRFENNRYLQVLENNRITPEQYSEYVRKQLRDKQLAKGYSLGGFVLPDEAKRIAELTLQEREVRLATVNVSSLRDKQSVSDDELQKYYQQNENRFMVPERIKVDYIEIDAAAMSEDVDVTSAEISAYYESNKARYNVLERRNYSVIQLKDEKEAKDVLAALRQGADFATLAKEKSQDVVSRRNGGEMGWLEKNSTPAELLQANLTEKGQLSDVVKSGVGYLIVRLNDIQPEHTKTLEEVRTAIINTLKQDKALDAYYALQQKIDEAAISENDSLAAAETAAGTKVKHSDWFGRDSVPAALNYPEVVRAIFSGNLYDEKGQATGNSNIINTAGERAFVVRVVEYEPAKIKPFEEVKAVVSDLVKQQKAKSEATAQGEKILAALNAGKGEEAMKVAGLSFSEKQTLNRQSQDNALTETVFSLPIPKQDKPVYALSSSENGNVSLIVLDKVNSPKFSQEELGAFSSSLLIGSTGVTFESLMENLRKEAKIKMGDVLER